MADKPQHPGMDRRGFLSMLVAGAATLTVGGGVGAAQAKDALLSLESLPSATLPGNLDSLFPYFRPGVTIVNGWEIRGAEWNHGAVELVCGKEGSDSIVVTLCGRTNSASGLETTEHFELFLMNNGSGARATEREAHQAVRIIAEVARMSTPTGEQLALFSNHAERLAAIEAGSLRYASAG